MNDSFFIIIGIISFVFIITLTIYKQNMKGITKRSISNYYYRKMEQETFSREAQKRYEIDNFKNDKSRLITMIGLIEEERIKQEFLEVLNKLSIDITNNPRDSLLIIENKINEYNNIITKIKKIDSEYIRFKLTNNLNISNLKKISCKVSEYLEIEPTKKILLNSLNPNKYTEEINILKEIYRKSDLNKFIIKNYQLLIEIDETKAIAESYKNIYLNGKNMFRVIYADKKIVVVEKGDFKETFKSNGVKYEVGKYYLFK